MHQLISGRRMVLSSVEWKCEAEALFKNNMKGEVENESSNERW